VLARCDERGGLVADGGRVEVRYDPSSPRAYFAGVKNLSPVPESTVFPDSHCGPAEAAPARAKGAPGRPQRASGTSPPTATTGDEIVAYADGACSGNPGPAGLGVVLLDGVARRELSEYLGRATNNIAELTAILRVAEAIADPARVVHVYTDSSYSIGVLTKGWKAKANRELVADVKDALARLANVRLHHVRGHAGVPLNERADELAREAVRSEASSGWQTVT
jgi:ribonuclease HI